MTNHTPEPWRYVVTRRHKDIIVASALNGTKIVKTGHIGEDDCYSPECCKTIEHANAKRIVECVNALVGIEDPMDYRMKYSQLLHDKMYFETRCQKLQDELNKITP